MNAFKLIRKTALPLLAILIVLPKPAAAQSVKAMVDAQNYVFQVQSAQPLRGPVRQLVTDNYTLAVTREKIVGDLPYFGRAYVAPADPSKSALQFTSKDFGYTVTPGKKEGWTVVIKPRDDKEIQVIQLNISSAGYTSVQIISTNRDAISFNGIVTAPDKH